MESLRRDDNLSNGKQISSSHKGIVLVAARSSLDKRSQTDYHYLPHDSTSFCKTDALLQ